MPGSHVREIRELRVEDQDGRWVVTCLYVNTGGQLVRYVKLADEADLKFVREFATKVRGPGETAP